MSQTALPAPSARQMVSDFAAGMAKFYAIPKVYSFYLAYRAQKALQGIDQLVAALELAQAYLDVSLGSPSWQGENPYPVMAAALALARGKPKTITDPNAEISQPRSLA